jgi:hypothetical protein
VISEVRKEIFVAIEFEKTTSLEILPVDKVFKDSGEYLLTCPHCSRLRGIDDEGGSIHRLKGEQYQDNLCDGWYSIADSVKVVGEVEELPNYF